LNFSRSWRQTRGARAVTAKLYHQKISLLRSRRIKVEIPSSSKALCNHQFSFSHSMNSNSPQSQSAPYLEEEKVKIKNFFALPTGLLTKRKEQKVGYLATS
jgi:hypothetical protein